MRYCMVFVLVVFGVVASKATAYIEAPYSLGQVSGKGT